MAGSTEREVKLVAPEGFRLPDLSGVAPAVAVGPARDRKLHTTYFDTADLRLARWGLTLRHRTGEGWTLKLPRDSAGGLLSRSELTAPGGVRTPPVELLGLARAYLRGCPVEPVARMVTQRRTLPVAGPDGLMAEVVFDRVSVIGDARAERFQEVEVELHDGGEEVLGPLLDRLREAGAVPSDGISKLVRALGERALAPPEVVVPRIRPGAAAEEVVRHALAVATLLIFRNDPPARLGEVEAVHQVRVGTRRLRSHLRTFRPVLDGPWGEELRTELAWLAAELGAVRDGEVMLDGLKGLAGRLPRVDGAAAGDLLESLGLEIAEARGRLLEAMSGERYLRLLDRLVEASARPRLVEDHPAEELESLARRPWRALRAAVRQLGPEPADEELHRVRILAKRARYAAEALAPIAGRRAERFAAQAAALQTVLGEHQDSVTAQGWLRRQARSPRRAFVAGELCALAVERQRDLRGRWPAAWRALRRRARTWPAR
jgi:CHAD domain-containing protein